MAPLLVSLFFLFAFFMVYPYLFYPAWVRLCYFVKKDTLKTLPTDTYQPFISCIISVYNEQEVIKAKIISILESDYPQTKLKIYVGSDGSTDSSNQIISELSKQFNQICFEPYQTRAGKTSVINKLTRRALLEHKEDPDHIIVYTDANIMLQSDTLTNLMQPFLIKQVAIVDTRIIQRSKDTYGVARTEKTYMNFESRLKKMEGELWGMAMGAFGGCYALRSTYSCELPEGLLVDDFYISMQAMIKGGLSLSNHEAICYENIPDNLKEEFNRKRRIASGNFQNLQSFLPRISAMGRLLAFVFISHKVIRWLFPFFLLSLFIVGLVLAFMGNSFFGTVVWMLILLGGIIPAIDWFMYKFGLKIQILRSWRYFVLMNIAVFIGFYRYLRGIHQSTWQPPTRTN